MKVLIVVDVQRDFCPGGALAVGDGDKIVPVINRLMRDGGYDLIVASLDWHPADHVSFAANHPGKALFEDIVLRGLPQKLWPVHCVQNTPGAQLHPDLETERIGAYVYKGEDRNVDSYSAFKDNGGRRETALREILERAAAAAGVPLSQIEVDIVGLATDYCVKATALDAAKLGLKTAVLIDGSRAVDQSIDGMSRVLRELQDGGVTVGESRERLPLVDRAQPRPAEINLAQ